MPLTPFHVGPAVLIRAALGRRVSVGVFAVVQVLIDLEPGWKLATHRWPVHGPSHTLLGVLLLSVVGAAVGKWACATMYPRLRRWLESPDGLTRRWLAELDAPTWGSALNGALIGGGSHLLLDGVMHGDMQPFAPWTSANPFLLEGSFAWIHAGCAISGAIGVIAWWLGGLLGHAR